MNGQTRQGRSHNQGRSSKKAGNSLRVTAGEGTWRMQSLKNSSQTSMHSLRSTILDGRNPPSSKYKSRDQKQFLTFKGEPSQHFNKMMKGLATEIEDIDLKKLGKHKVLTAKEKLLEESARNIRIKGKIKDSRDLGDFDPMLLIDAIEEKRKEKPTVDSTQIKSALVQSILQDMKLEEGKLELPSLKKIKTKLNKKKEQRVHQSKAKIDTNLAGKKIKNPNQLEFERKKGKLFKSKKMDSANMEIIKNKLDKDINNIVDYSKRVKDEVSKQADLKHSLKNALSSKRQSNNVKNRNGKMLLLSLGDEAGEEPKNPALMRSLSATFHTANASAKNKANMKLNHQIIDKCMSLQSKSTSLKDNLNYKEEVVHKIYDDFQKLVEFNTEVWYDKDIDEIYDTLVLDHLKEEQYMPKIHPLISFKHSDALKNSNKMKRMHSMPKKATQSAIVLKNKLDSRNSVLVTQMPMLAQNKHFDEIKGKQEPKVDLSLKKVESHNVIPSSNLSPVTRELKEDNKFVKLSEDECTEQTQKKVGKVSFGFKTNIHRSKDALFPSLVKEKHETSSQSLCKMPRIVRKILENKLDIDSDFIKSIEQYEKAPLGDSIQKIGNSSKVRSYFEHRYREKELVVNFKSMDNFAKESVQEYRKAQKHKALALMKKLGTKFLA
ncbi:unnamed protein product [Moneuplotes crassus]|uniref:Uncharacterized protein n=1 Tax=Euplotes crassus TaxID=5936 RepID=A0AAD1U2K2_EUPCR|nr:unnamed protein product [Moneuplotes crassus]